MKNESLIKVFITEINKKNKKYKNNGDYFKFFKNIIKNLY